MTQKLMILVSKNVLSLLLLLTISLIYSPKIFPSTVNCSSTDLSNNVCTLGINIGTSDTSIPINPTNNGATEFDPLSSNGARVLVDNEVIYYTAVSTLGETGAAIYDYLLNAQRGDPLLANTHYTTHSANTTVWKALVQAEQNRVMLKFTLSCDGDNVRWSQLKLKRATIPGGNVQDSDISAIKVWRDSTGTGILSGNSVLVSTGICYPQSFGSSYTTYITTYTGGNLVPEPLAGSEGMATIDLDDPVYRNQYTPGVARTFAVVTTTPTVYFITFDVAQSARQNDTIGCSLAGFNINTPNTVSYPATISATPVIEPTRNIMRCCIGAT